MGWWRIPALMALAIAMRTPDGNWIVNRRAGRGEATMFWWFLTYDSLSDCRFLSSSLVFTTLWWGYIYNPYLSDKEAEVQRDQVFHSKAQSDAKIWTQKRLTPKCMLFSTNLLGSQKGFQVSLFILHSMHLMFWQEQQRTRKYPDV